MLATEKLMLDEPMTNDEALNWILQVDGRLFRTPTKLAVEAWVAVVRVPAASPRKKWIIGLGGTMEEAAHAAEQQWQTLWTDLGTVH